LIVVKIKDRPQYTIDYAGKARQGELAAKS
jgi:hypothetical protein